MTAIKHIVITGATGFIGSAVLAETLAAGRRVTVLLRPDSRVERLAKLKGFETLVYAKLTDKETIVTLDREKPDVFIDCGWRGVGGSERNEAYQIVDNVPKTIDSVELAAAVGCRQWIGLGSQAEYGNQNRRLSEDAPLNPTTIYGKAKLAAGISALALCNAHQLTGVWLRVFSTYGPNDSPHWLLPYVIQEFLAGRTPKLTRCEQLWDYLYIEDAARAVLATANGTTSGIFNLGSGQARPLRDYIESVRSELASSVQPMYGAMPYRLDQVMHLEANISRLVGATGWRPSTALSIGIRKTVAFEKDRLKVNIIENHDE